MKSSQAPISEHPTNPNSSSNNPIRLPSSAHDSAAFEAIQAAIDQKALDVKGIDVSKVCDFADCFVIASGTSKRHVKAVSDKIVDKLKSQGHQTLSITGADIGEWVVLDFGDLVVHVFYEPTRQYFEFDELWSKGSQLELEDSLKEQMRMLRTGSF